MNDMLKAFKHNEDIKLWDGFHVCDDTRISKTKY